MDYQEFHGRGERLLLIPSCHCRKPGGPWAAMTVSYAETNCYLKSLFLFVFWMLNVPVPHCLRLVSFMTSFSTSIEKNISSPTSMA